MNLTDLTAYLDEYLAIAEVPDYRGAYNGLQVEGRAEVKRVAVAVDACQATIEAAIGAGADMMIVHHGLFWGRTAPVTGAYYRRLATLIRAEVSLYSCHLPLDAHPEVGNNHVLARRLELEVGGTWGLHEGVPIGVWAHADLAREELTRRLADTLGVTPLVLATGPKTVQRVGIVTGGGGTMIAEAKEAGCDALVTGEGAHHTYFDAEELGINVLYAGHYATETVGVQALATHLEQRFGLETLFVDHPTGL